SSEQPRRVCSRTRVEWRELITLTWSLPFSFVLTTACYGAANSSCLGIEERPVSVAAPEVAENDDTSDRRVCTPKGREGVPLELHYNQENCQVCSAEHNHHLDLGKKQRTASCNHIQQRNRHIICRLIDVNDAVPPDIQLQWERR